MYRISALAGQFGISRSTLLYYDRIGLLKPSGRSGSGYRLYSSEDRERLKSICSYRQAGLTIENILTLLEVEGDRTLGVLKMRLQELTEEIQSMQVKQRVLSGMLQAHAAGNVPVAVDKDLWVEMLRSAGMDDAGLMQWHCEFERRAPDAHHAFLISLGINEREVLRIRRNSSVDAQSKP